MVVRKEESAGEKCVHYEAYPLYDFFERRPSFDEGTPYNTPRHDECMYVVFN